MRRVFILFSLLIGIAGCGDLAPTDATVDGPKDGVMEITRTETGTPFFRPLDFLVTNAAGEPVPKVQIEFFAGGGVDLTDINGSVLANPKATRMDTDDRGIGRIGSIIPMSACDPLVNEDIKVEGSVLGTVGSASFLWSVTVTRKCSVTTTTP